MPVPNIYNVSGEPKVISLSIQDTAQGTAYITYYGAGLIDASSGSNVTTHLLLPSITPSSDIRTPHDGNVGAQTDFNLLIKKPLIVEGDAFVSFAVERDSTGNARWSAIIKKVSGATTTDLASGSGAICTSSTARRQVIKMVVPTTNFKLDDTFRVRIESRGDTGGNSTLFHDPTSRIQTTQAEPETSATENTDMIVDIPVKLID